MNNTTRTSPSSVCGRVYASVKSLERIETTLDLELDTRSSYASPEDGLMKKNAGETVHLKSTDLTSCTPTSTR
jgi:hypothetical protein